MLRRLAEIDCLQLALRRAQDERAEFKERIRGYRGLLQESGRPNRWAHKPQIAQSIFCEASKSQAAWLFLSSMECACRC